MGSYQKNKRGVGITLKVSKNKEEVRQNKKVEIISPSKREQHNLFLKDINNEQDKI